jgi:molybdate transport system regulatory protein
MAAIRITARVMAKGEGAFGPGKAALLEQIAAEGSISKAAKAMDMSYSRAWQLVDSMNKHFRKPLVEPKTGGRKGGGAALTRAGEEVLSVYRKMEQRLAADAESFFPEFEKRLK